MILSCLRWGRFSDRVKALLQAFTALVGLALVVVLAVMAWRAHEDRGYVIEAFTTPPALAQQGLTGEALAGEIMDHISTIERVTAGGSISRSDQVKADRREDFKVEIPETGLSLNEVWRAPAASVLARADALAPDWARNHLLWGEALKLGGHAGEAAAQVAAANRLGLSATDRAALDRLRAQGASGAPRG